MPDPANLRPRLEVHLLFPPDTTLGATLVVAGLRPAGRVGMAEVWVTDSLNLEGGDR